MPMHPKIDKTVNNNLSLQQSNSFINNDVTSSDFSMCVSEVYRFAKCAAEDREVITEPLRNTFVTFIEVMAAVYRDRMLFASSTWPVFVEFLILE